MENVTDDCKVWTAAPFMKICDENMAGLYYNVASLSAMQVQILQMS